MKTNFLLGLFMSFILMNSCNLEESKIKNKTWTLFSLQTDKNIKYYSLNEGYIKLDFKDDGTLEVTSNNLSGKVKIRNWSYCNAKDEYTNRLYGLRNENIEMLKIDNDKYFVKENNGNQLILCIKREALSVSDGRRTNGSKYMEDGVENLFTGKDDGYGYWAFCFKLENDEEWNNSESLKKKYNSNQL